MIEPKKTLAQKREAEHYVNNKDFSNAVMEYAKSVKLLRSQPKYKDYTEKELKKVGDQIPRYIGECFLKIANGLSNKYNFVGYTYKEEMVMDAVENCVKAIMNYNIDAATRSGTPNAFAYFTQISYFAFLRRISKEKKQQDIKMRFIEHSGIENFMTNDAGSSEFVTGMEAGFIDDMKSQISDDKTKFDSNVKITVIKDPIKLETFM